MMLAAVRKIAEMHVSYTLNKWGLPHYIFKCLSPSVVQVLMI